MDLFDLKERVAIVTGGNGGIGLGMAEGLAGAGASVVVAARDAAKGEAAVESLKGLGVRSGFVALQARDEASCRSLIEAVISDFGRVDVLVNNAGTNVRKQPEEYTLTEWQEVIETNLTSAFMLSQGVYPHMKSAGGGKIINIGSMMSIFGASFTVPYASSKGGIVQMTKGMACAWGKDNIQVNAVLPGWIDTELTRRGRQQVEGLHERVEARTPAGRWGIPGDLSGIAVFLASAASDFLTGTAIPVDGGYSVQGG
ncbi:MAG: 2-deoxy-D-gluconate 3-dehydrogenase [Proteobacteria bacterium]|jgi:2-deoxy-D-gluconate 3-dehydrogenase|nr:2-deoxy-D-gluconate 3-dehydrogenase [Pseudomonadota bacterium]MDP6137345.1 glucose 1-dehydrogenase [Arenicellales bacterium]HJP09174.1 glucose 1-dehydrogenase [Arenicellales bacterium]|tara:strand:- start:1566 stop:2333 length:768 start_codon:yes stop_codon:yes gene_type:complete